MNYGKMPSRERKKRACMTPRLVNLGIRFLGEFFLRQVIESGP